MLTQRDIDVFADTGNITPDRIRAMIYALRKQAGDARSAAFVVESHAAAALRGKATAYIEAVMMLESLLDCRRLPLPKRVRRAHKMWLAERRLRKAELG